MLNYNNDNKSRKPTAIPKKNFFYYKPQKHTPFRLSTSLARGELATKFQTNCIKIVLLYRLFSVA